MPAENLRIEHLADHAEYIPTLADWLIEAWPSWYGTGCPGDVHADLNANSNLDSLPIGFVAVRDSQLCGYVSLKLESVTGYEHLGPWVGAALVPLPYRRQGIGRALIKALEAEAKALGYKAVYSGNRCPGGILVQRGWLAIDHVTHNEDDLYVYQKAT